MRNDDETQQHIIIIQFTQQTPQWECTKTDGAEMDWYILCLPWQNKFSLVCTFSLLCVFYYVVQNNDANISHHKHSV